jgi:hypothetical protein
MVEQPMMCLRVKRTGNTWIGHLALAYTVLGLLPLECGGCTAQIGPLNDRFVLVHRLDALLRVRRL